MYSNNDITVSINNLPSSLTKLQDIFHIERTYIYDEIVIDQNNYVKHNQTTKIEKLFVIATEKQIKTLLPTNCKLFRKLSRDEQSKLDINRCITYEYLVTRASHANTLQPDYIPNTSTDYYTCKYNIKHIFNVKKNNIIIQYESKYNKDGNLNDKIQIYFIASIDDLCNIDENQFIDIQKINFNNIPSGTKVYHNYELDTIPKIQIDPGIYPNRRSSIDIPILDNMYEIPESSNISRRNSLNSVIRSPLMSFNQDEKPENQNVRRSPPISTREQSQHDTENNKIYENDYQSVGQPGIRSTPTSPTKATTNKSANKNEPITYKELNKKLSDTYNFEECIQSTTIDIISVYLKGQKLLYIEAKVYCEQNLYALMLPAIFINAICSILSLILRDYSSGALVVSSLTAINSFILTLVTYLKLDAKAEAHKTTAYSFEKLQSLCEFSSGRLLFMDKKVSPSELVEEIATQVKDIKDKNQFILPEYIRYKFPVLYTTNVFAEVKRIQINEILLMNKLKILINDGLLIQQKIKDNNIDLDIPNDNSELYQKLKDENKKYSIDLDKNYTKQNDAFDDIIKYRTQYIDIDRNFKLEIEEYIQNKKSSCNYFLWLKT